jgi:DNA-binding PadR family transcriptional regulator
MHQHVFHADLFILACLIPEPKTATAWYVAVMQATGEGIEPGTFSRLLARLERRGWIAASRAAPPLRLYQITDEGALALARAQAYQHREQLQEGRHPDWQRGRKQVMWLVLWLLRLYPPAWRERYAAEMVALLEQHQITLWTGLDLLVGALDARLDPHYRRVPPPPAWVRIQRSWKGIGSALTAFGFAFVGWVFATVDLGLPQDLNCSLYDDSHCRLRVEVTQLAPAVPNALDSLLNVLVTIIVTLFLCLLLLGAGWFLAHMRRAPLRNGARLLAFLALIPLWSVAMADPWWTLLLAVPAVALVAESVGAMAASSLRAISRANAWQRTATLVVGLSVSLSMILICIIPGADSLAWWRLFLQYDFFAPRYVEILVSSVVMVLATLMVLMCVARSAWTLRALSTTPPGPQEPA